jgi:GNAT superfamily N-acetyltransferase
MLEFIKINEVESKIFHEAISIYVNSIPPEERQTAEIIRNRVLNKTETMFVGCLDDTAVLCALTISLENTGFLVIDYLAVREEFRTREIGSKFIKFLIRTNKSRNILIEVDNPIRNPSDSTLKRRVEFYRRNGAKQLKDVKYFLPPLQNGFQTSPIPMLVMLISKQEQTCLPGSLVKTLFIQIYEQLYSRSNDDQLLYSILDSVPPSVKLV